jgi:hypothetical protein
MMTRYRGFGDLERIILDPADSGLIDCQLVRTSSQAGAEDNKFCHKLLTHCDYRHGLVQVKRKTFIYNSRAVKCSTAFQHLAKLCKKRSRIVRPWRGFRMILHTEDRFGFVVHSLNSLIIQVDPIHRHIAGKRFGIHGETMVLGSDLHLARL